MSQDNATAWQIQQHCYYLVYLGYENDAAKQLIQVMSCAWPRHR